MSTESGPPSLKAGDVVARRYVVLRPLREESCGGVWLVHDRLVGLDLGLKFVSRRWERFDEAREALRREGALALKLRHPHILQVLYYGDAEEGAFLLQEPFPGDSLLVHLARLERFRLPQALTILEQTAQALEAAHRAHEVHQALDPSQVLIHEGTTKLANFSCTLKEESDRVNHLELKAYVAPEVLRGEPVSPAANVFSLGVLGFRLAAGSLPYPLTFDEPFPYRLEQVPVDLEEIPLPLQNLLLQCLAPDPRDRFEDAGAFLAALEQRRESWRTPPQVRWFGWTPEKGRSAAQEVGSRATALLTRLREGGKEALEKVRSRWQELQTTGQGGKGRTWFLGAAAVLAAAVLLVWGGRALFRKTGTPPPAAPAPSELNLPPAGGPPLSGAPEASLPSRMLETPAAPILKPAAAPPGTPAPAGEERYQLLVATYAKLEQAQALKKRLQAKKFPTQITRVTSDQKKTFYLVKAGPYPGKKQAEEAARRLKSEEQLPHTPKIVKISGKTSQSEPRRPSR